MDKETRIKYLTSLAGSNEGKALREHFEEQIRKLTDARNYDKADFEIEGKTSIKAAIVLEQIMKDLHLLKIPKTNREKNLYL